MSKNIAEDYFTMTHSPRDGALSPTSSISNNPLHLSLSWGNTPERPGLTKVKSHTGTISFKNTAVSKAQSDNKIYPYHKVHLTVPVPDKLKPVTPEEVLENITGRCINCSNKRSTSCNHLTIDTNSHSFKSPVRNKGGIKLKSILSRRGNKETSIDNHFSNSVSFDTVNLKFSDDLNNYPLSSFSDEDDYYCGEDNENFDNGNNTLQLSPIRKNSLNNPFDDINRGRSKMGVSINARTPSRSPSRSLSPRARSPLPTQYDMVTEKEESMKNFFSLKYPTSPIITHDACTLTRTHKLFDDMYAGRLKAVEPKLNNRVVMCYISGRKHTWVGIDWATNELLEDGDTLVIVASIKNPGRSLSRFQRRNSDIISVSNNVSENLIRNSPEYAQNVTNNIMKYVLSLINPDRVIKITVELAIGSTKDVFQDMFELYQPSLVIIGAKPGRAAPTRSWATKRLSDRIVKTSPVPTIIISPINMGLFENKLFKTLDKRMEYLKADKPNTYHQNDELLNELDNVGVYSLEDQREYIRQSASNDDFILRELDNFIKNKKEQVKNKDINVDSSDASDYDNLAYADDEKDVDDDIESDNSRDDSNDNLIKNKKKDESDSILDDASVDSTNPPAFVVTNDNSASFKLKRLELEAQVVIYKEVSKLESEPLTKDSFKHLLTVVSDAAHQYGVQLAESAKLGGEESKLVRTLTGAPEQVERRKSMVSEAIENDDFNEKLRKFRQQKKLEQQQKGSKGNSIISSSRNKTPKINIEAPKISRNSSSGINATKSPTSSIISSGGSLSSSKSNTSINGNKTVNTGKPKKKKGGFFGSLFGKK